MSYRLRRIENSPLYDIISDDEVQRTLANNPRGGFHTETQGKSNSRPPESTSDMDYMNMKFPGRKTENITRNMQPSVESDYMRRKKGLGPVVPAQENVENDDKPGFFGRMKDKFTDPEYRAKLALALNSMRYAPDASIATYAQGVIDTAQKNRNANKTIDYFNKIGRKDIATAIEAQPELAANVYSAYLQNQLSPKSTFNQKSGAELNAALAEQGLPPAYDSDKVYNVDATTGKVTQIGGGDTNINMPSLTESQGAATNFYQRALNANNVLVNYENQGTELGQALLGKVPLLGNMLITPEYQVYQALKSNFLSAVLRKESGAVIGVEELVTEDKKYFPQVGDSQSVVEEKRRARLDAIRGLQIQAGEGANLVGNNGLPSNVTVKVKQ